MTGGTQLGRYELLEQLGEGGMGAVWLARLTGAAGFEKLCIVKTVLPSIAKDAEFVSRFLHEGRVLTQLSHGNIAQVLDMNEADGQLFLALEYVAGVDLSQLHQQVRAAKEFMPLELVVALITQAAEGLGAAHRKAALDGSPLNVVHRDVSPHNIMVSYEGEVKVIDFGIAKSEARSRHTAQASVLGKLGYMAPEQARGEPLDHRADQFALGIVLWELLSNQAWVKRGTLTEMVVAMAHPSVRSLAPLRTDVPASLEAVVLKALAPLPEDRYLTTDDFAQALMGELLKLGPPPTKPQLGQYVRSRCAADFAAQRQLLTRMSTQRSPPPGEDGQKVDLLGETAVRPAVRSEGGLGPDTGVVTAAARPGSMAAAAQPTMGAGSSTPAGTSVEQGQTMAEPVLTVPARAAVAPVPGDAGRATVAVDGTSSTTADRTGTAPGDAAGVPTTADRSGLTSGDVAGVPTTPGRAALASTAISVSGSTTADRFSMASSDGRTTPGRAAVDATAISSSGSTTPGRAAVDATAISPSGSTTPEATAIAASGSTSGGVPTTAGRAAVAVNDSVSPLPDPLPRGGEGDRTAPGRVAVPAVVRSEAPLTSGELAAASSKRSPAVLALGLLAVLGVGVGLFFALRTTEVGPSAVVDAGTPVVVPIVAPPVVDAGLAEASVDAGLEVELPTPPPEGAPPTMQVAGRLVGQRWVVTNQERRNGTRCRMTLPGQRVIQIGTLPAGGRLELPLKRFVFDATAPVLSNQARVDCSLGFGLIELP